MARKAIEGIWSDKCFPMLKKDKNDIKDI